MRRRTIALLVAAAALAGCATGPRVDDPNAMIGRPAPKLGSMTWIGRDGKLGLKDFRGRVVVVHWWTDGCPACVRNIERLTRLYEMRQAAGLVVVGIYFPNEPGTVNEGNIKEVSQILGIHFPVAIDRKWKSLQRWWLGFSGVGVKTPTFVLDRSGVVRAIFAGQELTDEDTARLNGLIGKLLEEAAPEG